MECKQAEVLISGYLDNELTQQDAQQVRVHLDNCEACRTIFHELKQLKAQMGQLVYPQTDLEQLEVMEQDLVSRAGEWSGWLLILFGALLAFGYGVYKFFTAPDMPPLALLIHGAMTLGGFVLFLTVLRQRLMTYRNDKYRKVKL